MTHDSPYQAPESQLINPEQKLFDRIEIFSLQKRIGRVRYLAYNFVANLVIMVIIGIATAITIQLVSSGDANSLFASSLFSIVVLLIYLIPIGVSFVLAARRLHDIDSTGWLCLLLLIPVINVLFALYLLFAPGTKGANQYGLQPAPNTAVTWVVGLFAPFAIIGVLAAIAIPAYYDYNDRARAAQYQSDD